MPTSKPTQIDGALKTPSEATRFEEQLLGARRRAKDAIGTFQDYVRAILHQDGLPEVSLRAVLRDRGTDTLHQKYLDSRGLPRRDRRG